jgi:hypothetical protein
MDSALIRLRKELGEYEDLVWVSGAGTQTRG